MFLDQVRKSSIQVHSSATSRLWLAEPNLAVARRNQTASTSRTRTVHWSFTSLVTWVRSRYEQQFLDNRKTFEERLFPMQDQGAIQPAWMFRSGSPMIFMSHLGFTAGICFKISWAEHCTAPLGFRSQAFAGCRSIHFTLLVLYILVSLDNYSQLEQT